MGCYPNPKETKKETNARRFKFLTEKYPEGIELLQRMAGTLLSRSEKQLRRKDGKRIVAKHNGNGVNQVKEIAKSRTDLNIVEEFTYGFKVSVNGTLIVAFRCKDTNCPFTNCEHRN